MAASASSCSTWSRARSRIAEHRVGSYGPVPRFLISTPGEGDWRIGEDDFERRLLARFPGAQLQRRDDGDDAYPVSASIEGEGPTVIVRLQRNGSTLSIDGDIDQAGKIARWYRDQVPNEQPLVFYDQEYAADVALGPDTTAEELAAPFR